MDIDEAFISQGTVRRIYCKITQRIARRAANTGLCCVTHWPNSGMHDGVRPFLPRPGFELRNGWPVFASFASNRADARNGSTPSPLSLTSIAGRTPHLVTIS